MNNFQSDNINELAAALSKAQGEFVPAIKDASNPFYNSKYADLNSVWATCRQPLSKNGLAIMQSISNVDNELTLITTLAHSSGQWMRSYFPMSLPDPNEKELNRFGKEVKRNRLHVIGSCITYLRRYALSSMIGIVTDEDDDGNSLGEYSGNEQKTEIKKDYKHQNKKLSSQIISDEIPPIEEKKFISESEKKELAQILARCGQEFQDEVWKFLGTRNITCYEEISPKLYVNIKKRINDELEKKVA